MVVQTVRFKSGLSSEEVQKTYEARAPQYRALPGLIQKFYLEFPDTHEYGAVYLWDSQEALDEFRKSELARTIPQSYKIQGAPDVHVGEVVMELREGVSSARR